MTAEIYETDLFLARSKRTSSVVVLLLEVLSAAFRLRSYFLITVAVSKFRDHARFVPNAINISSSDPISVKCVFA